MVLKKDVVLYARDEAGELIPQDVDLVVDEDDEDQAEFKGETIKAIPLTRGELKKLFAKIGEGNDKDSDAEIIEKHCIEPKFTIEELKHAKPVMVSVIVNSILSISGISTKKNRKKALQEKEDDFAKN